MIAQWLQTRRPTAIILVSAALADHDPQSLRPIAAIQTSRVEPYEAKVIAGLPEAVTT
jgi:hypothetical protein